MNKLSDLRDKEVINVKTGTRLGLINDMVIDTKNSNCFTRAKIVYTAPMKDDKINLILLELFFATVFVISNIR